MAAEDVWPEQAIVPGRFVRRLPREQAVGTRLGEVLLCGGAAVLAGGAFWLVRRALIDDAYITLAYARNLATDGHWGLIPTEPANSATSPLNVLLLGGAAALFRLSGGVQPIWGLGVVFVGLAVVMAWCWSRIVATLSLPPAVPALGVAIVLVNPFVLSAVGLEVLLIPTVLIGLLAAAVRGRPGVFGVVSGLALLARADLVVFVVPLALASAGVRGRLPRAMGAATAVALPWDAWSWWHFGSAIPDTFVIKTLQRSFGDWTFANGPGLYYGRDALATVVTFAPVVAGVVALLGWTVLRVTRPGIARPELLPAAALVAAGAGYYGVYALLGVPPYQWYYVPTFAATAIGFSVLIGAVPRGRVQRRAVGAPGMAFLACLVVASLVSDVRGGVPWRVPVIFGNWRPRPTTRGSAGKWDETSGRRR